MPLQAASRAAVEALMQVHILKGKPARLMQATPLDPSSASGGGGRRVLLGNMWVPLGPEPVRDPRDFVITPSIDARIKDMARVLVAAKYPVLLQGPTSAGKTSGAHCKSHRVCLCRRAMQSIVAFQTK
jgi:midasin